MNRIIHHNGHAFVIYNPKKYMGKLIDDFGQENLCFTLFNTLLFCEKCNYWSLADDIEMCCLQVTQSCEERIMKNVLS